MVGERKETSESRLPPVEPVDVSGYLRDAIDQGQLYLKAQAARIKALVRSAMLLGFLGLASAFVALTIVIVSVVLFCVGIADGIAQLLGGRQWAGDLITGGGVLGVLLIGGWVGVKMLMNSARRQTIASFEKQRRVRR
jgi:Putative Actinobacterial Holin-X, holin superfamily III